MKILLPILIIGILVILYPFVNKFITQVVFKSKKRTRKHMLKYYDFYRKQYPDESEKDLLMNVLDACFTILDREPDANKPASLLTRKEAEDIVREAEGIDNIIEIVSRRGFSPDMVSWF